MMSVMSPAADYRRSSRTLVFLSVALNLFFVSLAGALAYRHYTAPPPPRPAPIDRSVAGRIDRIAATLPTEDAAILRNEFRERAVTVEALRGGYRHWQDEVRGTLRADPFNPDAMRAAMAETRAARQAFDHSLHDLIVAAAEKMSMAGRNKLADWPSSRESVNTGR
jgi:uncharacterized membrane protein